MTVTNIMTSFKVTGIYRSTKELFVSLPMRLCQMKKLPWSIFHYTVLSISACHLEVNFLLKRLNSLSCDMQMDMISHMTNDTISGWRIITTQVCLPHARFRSLHYFVVHQAMKGDPTTHTAFMEGLSPSPLLMVSMSQTVGGRGRCLLAIELIVWGFSAAIQVLWENICEHHLITQNQLQTEA